VNDAPIPKRIAISSESCARRPSSGNDTVFGYELLFGWNMHRNVVFETFYGDSDYAQQTASGFESHHWGYLFRFSF